MKNPNLRERTEDIVGKYGLTDKQIQEATEQILRAVEEMLPEEKQGIEFHSGRQNSKIGAYSPKDNQKIGFNACLAQIKERIGR